MGRGPRLLAARFACSSVATAAAALSLAERAGGDREGNARRLDALVAAAATAELAVSAAAERRYRERGVAAPLEEGRWAAVDKLGALAIGAALPLACHAVNAATGRRSPGLSVAASLAVLAGGLMMRQAIMEAGNESAQRPRDYFRFTQPAAGAALPRRAARPSLERQ
jgi:protein NrfD